MADSPGDILETIPKLVESADTAALAGLREHADKKVRKAVRRAIHQLASRGIEVPEQSAKQWSFDGSMQSLRGALDPAGYIDTRTTPGVTRFWWVTPSDEFGGQIDLAVMAADDTILDFASYGQTDGQRDRMSRDWDRNHGDRKVPEAWVRERLRWGREQTVAAGRSVPPAMDRALVRLGELPQQRPACFLRDQLATEAEKSAGSDTRPVLEILLELGVVNWPLLFDADVLGRVLQAASAKIEELRGESSKTDDSEDESESKPAPTQEELDSSLASSIVEDEGIRGALRSCVANVIEDAAVSRWLDGSSPTARRLLAIATSLRTSPSPESTEGVVELCRMQISGLAAQQMQQSGMRGA